VVQQVYLYYVALGVISLDVLSVLVAQKRNTSADCCFFNMPKIQGIELLQSN
jgi:hypothetical protein